MSSSNAGDDVQLLQASVAEDSDSEFRLLFHKKHFKYVTIAAGVYDEDDMCFAPALLSILPPFPKGRWNYAYIAKHTESGKSYFKTAEQREFPSVQNTWHTTFFDYLHLNLEQKIRTNIYETTVLGSPGKVLVAKFARFSWEVDRINDECAAYSWIKDTYIGPKFLGNITEEGRVIGIVLEHIPGARHASSADYAACKEALSRLHRLGIGHGDINKHNFLIVDDKKAILIDFDCARKTEHEEVLDEETRTLEMQLADTSGKGGRIPDH